MNHTSFFYTVPYTSQQQIIFTQPSTSPYIFAMPHSVSCYPIFSQQLEFTPSKPMNICLNNYKSDFQQNKKSKTPITKDYDLDDSESIQKDRKRHRIQRLRDNKGRYYGVRKLPIKEKYKQNPKRNVITNIGNQLLSFIANRSKSMSLVKKVDSNITETQIYSFYQFILNLRKVTDYYLNVKKMKQLWYPTALDLDQVAFKNTSILRGLSYFYLNNMIHLFVLNSGKIKRSSKIYHIKAIRALIRQLAPKKDI